MARVVPPRILRVLALAFADYVISEIADPGLDDPDKYRFGKRVIPLALRFIDLDVFKPAKPITGRRYWFVFIGRLEEEKGVLLYVNALRALRSIGIRVAAAAAGKGSLERFMEEADDEGILEYLGFLEHSEVPGLLNEARFLVLPSRYEGVPTVVLEALATGTLVIATRVGGIPLFVRDGHTGFLVERSAVALYKVFLRALRLSGDELCRMSREARSLAENMLSLEKAVARYRVIARLVGCCNNRASP